MDGHVTCVGFRVGKREAEEEALHKGHAGASRRESGMLFLVGPLFEERQEDGGGHSVGRGKHQRREAIRMERTLVDFGPVPEQLRDQGIRMAHPTHVVRGEYGKDQGHRFLASVRSGSALYSKRTLTSSTLCDTMAYLMGRRPPVRASLGDAPASRKALSISSRGALVEQLILVVALK